MLILFMPPKFERGRKNCQLKKEDLLKSSKLIGVNLSKSELSALVPVLNQTLDSLKPLSKMHIPREVEPVVDLTYLLKKGVEDIEDIQAT